jgi:hypothetical protein
MKQRYTHFSSGIKHASVQPTVKNKIRAEKREEVKEFSSDSVRSETVPVVIAKNAAKKEENQILKLANANKEVFHPGIRDGSIHKEKGKIIVSNRVTYSKPDHPFFSRLGDFGHGIAIFFMLFGVVAVLLILAYMFLYVNPVLLYSTLAVFAVGIGLYVIVDHLSGKKGWDPRKFLEALEILGGIALAVFLILAETL